MIYRINEEYFQVELYRETTDTEPCEVIELDVAIHAYHDWQKIVRCKECIYLDRNCSGEDNWCYKFGYDVEDDDYCSYGERKEQ